MTYQAHRPSVAELAPLCEAFYEFDGNGCGGSLHIVLDDGNLEDSNVDYCIDYALGKPETRHDQSQPYPHDLKGELLGRLIRMLSQTQRRKLYSRYYRPHLQMGESEFIAQCRALLDKYGAGGNQDALEPAKTPSASEAQKSNSRSDSSAPTTERS